MERPWQGGMVWRGRRALPAVVLAGLSLLPAAAGHRAAAVGFAIRVDPQATYLRTSSDPSALNVVPVALGPLGLAAGDRVRVTRLGDFDCGAPCVDDRVGMIAVFSSNATLGASSLAHRVPGAIEAGPDVVTAPTHFGGLVTDIPEDFAVPGIGVAVTVPVGATHLFVAASDSLYGDNSDPDGDLAVRIDQLIAPTADAGPDQSVHAGQPVTLDGSASADDNTAAGNLLFAWTLTRRPAGSQAILIDSATSHPSFAADTPGDYVASLTVTDADGLASEPDTVVISSLNAAPLADAGPDQGTFVGQPVFLDASASSDPDSDPIEISWTLSVPAGSAAALTNASTAVPSFTPDIPGSYLATVVVTDSFGASSAADATVSAISGALDLSIGIDPRRAYLRTNSDPSAANAVAFDLSALQLAAGDTIALTRLGDFDCGPPCGDDALGMNALFSSSSTLLSGSQAHRVPGAIDAGDDVITAPTFFGGLPTDIPEDFAVPGTRVVVPVPAGATHLFVTARDVLYGDNTDPDGDFAVHIKRVAPPTANAGADQAVHVGQLATLDGSGSFDDDTATADLLFAWTLVTRPEGSAAALIDANTMHPSIAVDVPGDYAVSLTVQDADGLSSQPDAVVISSLNAAPVADAGTAQGTFVGQSVILDGSASYDPDSDPLQFSWTLAPPAGSGAALTNATTASPSFTPDLPGSYLATLVVTDSFGASSSAANVAVSVVSGAQYASIRLLNALDILGALRLDQVTTRGNRNALQRFVTQAVAAIEAGDLEEAGTRIRQALDRTDGCVVRGLVDGNGPGRDWVIDCDAQMRLFDELTQALDALGPDVVP